MKKTLLILFSVLTISNVFSQDVDDKFRVHSLSLGIGAPRSSKISLGLGGNMDLTFSKGKHLFKFMAGGASELSFNLFGNTSIRDSFEDPNVEQCITERNQLRGQENNSACSATCIFNLPT